MLRLVFLAILVIATVAVGQESDHASPRVRTTPDYLREREHRIAELYRKVLPTVVTVHTTSEAPTDTGIEEGAGVGSGVLISPEGHILTAAHLVLAASSIIVETEDGLMRKAELVYSEPSADLALLGLEHPAAELRHATLGDSNRLAVGQEVYVIGSPYGLAKSFSVGHISAFREFSRLYDGTILAEFIQTDAAINRGTSGGPVFNSIGEVIGISSRILTASGGSQGLGFAITINTAKELLALEERAWTGLETIYLSREQLATFLNLDAQGGLLIQRVVKGSPADDAGLQGGSIPAQIQGRQLFLGGDLILELGHQEACHSECLRRAQRRIRKQDRIRVEFLRNGKKMETEIDVSETRKRIVY